MGKHGAPKGPPGTPTPAGEAGGTTPSTGAAARTLRGRFVHQVQTQADEGQEKWSGCRESRVPGVDGLPAQIRT